MVRAACWHPRRACSYCAPSSAVGCPMQVPCNRDQPCRSRNSIKHRLHQENHAASDGNPPSRKPHASVPCESYILCCLANRSFVIRILLSLLQRKAFSWTAASALRPGSCRSQLGQVLSGSGALYEAHLPGWASTCAVPAMQPCYKSSVQLVLSMCRSAPSSDTACARPPSCPSSLLVFRVRMTKAGKRCSRPWPPPPACHPPSC